MAFGSLLRHRVPPVPALLVVAVVAAWAPIAVDARRTASWDLFYEHLPFRAYAGMELAGGGIPLWAPDVRAGYPLHANGEAALLSPLELPLRLVLGAHRAVDATFVLCSLLGALSAAALAKALGATAPAQALAGLAFGLSGRLTSATWPNAAFVTALLPVIPLALERMRRNPAAAGPIRVLAFTLGAALLAGRPQTLAVALPFAASHAAAGLITDVAAAARRGARLWRALLGRALPLIVGVSLGAALGAPQLLPTLELASASARIPGLSVEQRGLPPLRATDLPLLVAALGSRGHWPEARAHTGVVTLALALWALTSLRGDRCAWRRRAVVAWGTTATGAFILALGPRTPLFGVVTALPLLGGMRSPARFLTVFSLAVALTGALALDRLAAAAGPVRRRVVWALVAVTALELTVSAWASMPWSRPEVDAAVPRVLAPLQAMPIDPSGAPRRFLALPETYLLPPQLATLLDASDARAQLEARDMLSGNRALLFGLSSAYGYGEPVALWQEAFLDQLSEARLDALGVAAVLGRVADGTGGEVNVIQRRPLEALLPRAMVVPEARAVASPAEAGAALDAGADPRRVVLLEDARAAAQAPGRFEPQPARIGARGANTVEVEIDAPGDGWLVLFEAWDRGWSARAGDRSLQVHRADGFFRAVRVAAGRQRVTFSYWPAGLTIGLLASASALAVSAGLGRACRGRELP